MNAGVCDLIEKATNSTSPELDQRLLKAIKSSVRSSDDELRVAVETLMEKMKREHAQVRYHTIHIVDELFMRSKLFRTLFIVTFDEYLSLSIGFRRNFPLPPPTAIASRLRSKSIELLEKWNLSFGIHYRQLRLGFDYLKNILKFQFPNIRENAARLQQERREREMRSKEILLKKYENMKENYPILKSEIRSTLDEIGECLAIIQTKDENDDNLHPFPSKNADSEDFGNSILRQIRLDSLKEGQKACETPDNKAVFDVLRDLYKLLASKHLLTIQDSISILVRVDLSDYTCRDSMLKELIDIRNRIKTLRKECEQLGCSLKIPTVHEEEEDLWEEGKIVVSNANRISGEASSSRKDLNATPHEYNHKSYERKMHSEDNEDSKFTSPRSKLLSKAPVLSWGSFLDTWGSNSDVLANHRGLELEGHWGRVDYDAVIPAEKIAELNVPAMLYEEHHEEIQPCRAPLRKGGLCPRRDLKVCPFHGPIIPRDQEGNPIERILERILDTTQMITQEFLVDHAQSSELQPQKSEQLARQAIKNVRNKDKEVHREREENRQLLKRAKLAEVRKHNEAVLRQAALASTSMSELGEIETDTAENRSMMKGKKPTLASMLRRKVTTKDRLSNKLLNSRITDATIRQLTQGEDAKYREAYPNQW